jgi:hypothetical protein
MLCTARLVVRRTVRLSPSAKGRAEALGGQLRMDSPPGRGTTLEMTLPLHDPTGPELPPGTAGAA